MGQCNFELVGLPVCLGRAEDGTQGLVYANVYHGKPPTTLSIYF